MAKEIVSDKDGVVVKKLASPKKTTVLDGNFRMSNFDDDVSSLNAGISGEGGGGSEKKGLEKAIRAEAASRKKTLVGNEGPDANGKIDWSKSQDCVDYICQAHEGSGNSNDEEGFTATAERCVNSFNKLFGRKDETGVHRPAQMTAEEIAEALKTHYVVDEAPAKKPARPARAAAKAEAEPEEEQPEPAPKKAPPKEELYYPITKGALEFGKGKKLLSGTHFEICKVLNCKHICMAQRKSGPIEHNGLLHAACANSENNVIDKKNCPQEQELSEKELFLFQMFLQQFNGDALQAKKLFFLSRAIQNK